VAKTQQKITKAFKNTYIETEGFTYSIGFFDISKHYTAYNNKTLAGSSLP
jgi:hypothetical protein